MSNKKTAAGGKPAKKLGLVDLYCLSIGQVIGAGIVTLVGPAIAMTGYSAWLSYLIAIIAGFFVVLPLVFITGTIRLSGGYYSLIGAMAPKKVAGMYAIAQLTRMVGLSLFSVSLGQYISSLWPQLNPTVVGIAFMTFFYLVNLMGVNMMAKFQKYMTYVLIATLLLFAVAGVSRIQMPVFDFSGPDFMPNGTGGLIAGAFLFMQSTTGYCMTMSYGKAAAHPKKHIPIALILSVPTLIILYCGVTIADLAVLPLAEVSNQPLTVAAKQLLPGPLFVLFIVGGPVMALATTMNATLSANCIPVVRSVADGWLPRSLISENRFGVSWKVYTINYVLGLLPLVLGFSVTTITRNLLLLNSILSFMFFYAYFQLPKKFPDAWKRSKWHVPNALYYFFCALGLAIQIAIFFNTCKKLNATIVIVSIVAVLICIAISLHQAKKPTVKVTFDVDDEE